jgi:hypothetical protein
VYIRTGRRPGWLWLRAHETPLRRPSCRSGGPFGVEVAAPAATVFGVIAAPYLGRTGRAMAGQLRVLDRGTDMVLAEHYTPVHHGRLTAATLETVTFDRPLRIGFRLVRGPVPHTP